MHVANQRQFYNEAFVRFSERNELFRRFKNITENWFQHIDKQIIHWYCWYFPLEANRAFTWPKMESLSLMITFLHWNFVLRCWRQQFVCISMFYAETIYICNSFLTIQVSLSVEWVNINHKRFSANIVSKWYKIS